MVHMSPKCNNGSGTNCIKCNNQVKKIPSICQLACGRECEDPPHKTKQIVLI